LTGTSTAAPTRSPTSSLVDNSVLIGGVVGGAVALVLLAAVIFKITRRLVKNDHVKPYLGVFRHTKIEKEKLFDVFVSYSWGSMPEQYNRQRVMEMDQYLRACGLVTWVDQDQVQARDIPVAIADGVERSKAFLVVVSQLYIDKVNSGNPNDNCLMEFTFGLNKLPHNVIYVVVDERLLSCSNWGGVFGYRAT
jgi:hypothetical protein